MDIPRQEDLHTLFWYNAPTGDLIRKPEMVHGTRWYETVVRSCGTVCGRPSGTHRYGRLRINGYMHSTHRVVWTMHHGTIPQGAIIDHIDRDPSNNRVENLRLADYALNAINRCTPLKNSMTGAYGVNFRKSRGVWRARIQVNGVRVELGTFHTKESAVQAYEAARCIYHRGAVIA